MITAEGIVLVVSANAFLFIINEDKEDFPLSMTALYFDDERVENAVLRNTGSEYELELQGSVFSLKVVSEPLFRWRLASSSSWTYTRGNLPRERGSCWHMHPSHPRYGVVHDIYMRIKKPEHPAIPTKTVPLDMPLTAV